MKAAAIDFVTSVFPGHGTCAKPALVQALTYANQSSARSKMIIHISDGFNTCAGSDATTYGEEILSEMQTRNTGKIPIHAITVGPVGSVNEAFMKRLAAENNGQYARVIP